MIIEYTAFGKTKKVIAEPYNMTPTEIYEEVLWVERGEDMYGLGDPQLKGKKVAIVRREDWLRAKAI